MPAVTDPITGPQLPYLRWGGEVAISPGALNFMAHPNDRQGDP